MYTESQNTHLKSKFEVTIYLKALSISKIFVGVIFFRVSRDMIKHVHSFSAANRYVTTRIRIHVIRNHKFARDIHGVVTILLAYIFRSACTAFWEVYTFL